MFTHQGRYEPILKGCSLAIERGDFVLLQGDSGSGKSTLVSLLGGLRRPSGRSPAGGRTGPAHTRRSDLAASHRRRSAVSREPCIHRASQLQSPAGTALPTLRPGSRGGQRVVPRTRSWTTAGANAGRARPDRRRDGLAAFARRTGTSFSGARVVAECGSRDAGRKPWCARSSKPQAMPGLRDSEGKDTSGGGTSMNTNAPSNCKSRLGICRLKENWTRRQRL